MKNKRPANARVCARLALALACIFTAQLCAAQATTQTLDRVFAFTPGRILNMATGNAPRPPDFTDTGVTGAAFSTCVLTAVNGLYCLDGQVLRNWPNPSNPSTSSSVFDCSDAALGLDRKSDGCTGMTVDDVGAIWIAGKKRNAHSVIKVTRKIGTTCTTGTAFATAPLCAQEYYSGRPSLVDIAPIDGDNARNFRPCPGCLPQAGVLGMEERKNAVFFPDPKTAPVVVVAAKDWGLSGKEVLQDIALLQIENNGGVDSYIVATTSNGRILARNPALGGAARAVFDIPTERGTAARCNSDTQQYGLRASATSSVLYVSDRNYCQVIALVPDSVLFLTLQNVQKNGVDVVLSTVDTDANPDVVYATVGLAIAPGISFALTDCKIACGIINDSDGDAAARLSSVQLVNEAISGATAFQIRGIPDCRYVGAPGFPASQLATCSQAGLVVNPNPITGLPDPSASGLCGSVTCPPAAQWLNVTPLLPSDVVRAYTASGNGNGVLPSLLISPQYRGQRRNGYRFEGLFVVTQPGVRYRNTFEGEFDVAGLEGSTGSLGCIANPARLIDWDVSTTVSEVYISTGGSYVDTLTNSGCSSTKTTGVRLSLLPYDLELSPDTWGPKFGSTTPGLTVGNDAVFARLMQKLFDELGYAQRELACKQVDPVPSGGTPPLSAADCSALASIWSNAKQKLDKCIAAGFEPKQSAGDENCQSFVSQLNNFRTRLPAATPAQDTANRVGELKARSITLLHVYSQRYLPSIPANGFCRERLGNVPGCPNPWN